jgi:SAM-dependent methyltransferase
MAESLFTKLRGVVFGRPPGPPPVHSNEELLARADEFNRNADSYWLAVAGDPIGRHHILNRPLFGRTAPVDLYRVGLMLSELHLGPGMEVLDFGAGTCWLSSFFNRMGCRTISVDVSPAALELGRELFGMDTRQRADLGPEFRVYDGRRLPLDDASVDRIACFDAFHHVPNQDELLAEMHRVLRPGGRLVMAEPGEGHSHAETSLYEEQVFEVLEHDFDILDVERRARVAGFTDVRLKPYLEVNTEPVSASDYVRLAGQGSLLDRSALRTGLHLGEMLRSSFRACAIMVLSKGEERRDSRSPGLLRAEIELLSAREALKGLARTALQARVRVRNVGDTLWRTGVKRAPGNVELGGHLLTPQGRPVTIDALRSALPREVGPGESVELAVAVSFPEKAGSYTLRLDLVSEGIMWFALGGSRVLDVPIESVAGDDQNAYRAHFALAEQLASPSQPRGSRLPLRVRLENRGVATWPRVAELGPGAMRVGVQLLDEQGAMLDLDYARADLPEQVPPGGACDVTFALRLPDRAGRFRLKIDLVQEGVCWFEEHGSAPLVIGIETTDEPTDSLSPGVLRAELRLEAPAGPVSVAAGESIPIRVRATNLGNTRWLCGEDGARGQVRLGARLVSASGTRDYWRAPLASDVEPGTTTELAAALAAPSEPGSYSVVLDLVDEGFAWFQDEGSPVASFGLEVRAG